LPSPCHAGAEPPWHAVKGIDFSTIIRYSFLVVERGLFYHEVHEEISMIKKREK
jgi:hypothetical protein